MILYDLDVKKEDLDLILKGLSDDGDATEEAKKVLLAYIAKGKEQEYPIGEVKRQLRANVNAEEGKKIRHAVDKLW